MIKITPDLTGVKRLISKVFKASTDMSPVTVKLAGILHNAVEENFAKEGRPKWSPLAKATIKQRTREKRWPGKILQRSGRLASSISARHDAMSAEVGTNVKVKGGYLLGAIHQFGTKPRTGATRSLFSKKGRTGIPARPFLKLTKEDIQDMNVILKRYLDNL